MLLFILFVTKRYFFVTKECKLWPWLWMPFRNTNTIVHYIFCHVLRSLSRNCHQPRMTPAFLCANVARVDSNSHIRIYKWSLKARWVHSEVALSLNSGTKRGFKHRLFWNLDGTQKKHDGDRYAGIATYMSEETSSVHWKSAVSLVSTVR